MKKLAQIMMVLSLLTVVGSVSAPAQERNVVTGYLTSITSGDQSFTKGLTSAEREFAVRVTLDSIQGTVLGFGEFGKSIVAQQAMLDLLMKAMENRWEVSLRLRREASDSRSSSRIVSVTVRP